MKKDLVLTVRLRSVDLAALVKYSEMSGEYPKSMSELVNTAVATLASVAREKGFETTVSEALELLEERFGMAGRSRNKRSVLENLLTESLKTHDHSDIEKIVHDAMVKK